MSLVWKSQRYFRGHNVVFTIRKRLILGTLISYGVAVAMQVVAMPTLAVELNTDTSVEVAVEVEKTETRVLGYSHTTDTVEQKVRSYFQDIPIMAEVAWCESRFEHTNSGTGTIIRGRVNPADVGVMQINQHYHQTTADTLNIDILSLEGNLEYARYLYEREGTRPWNASRPCWQKSTLAMR